MCVCVRACVRACVCVCVCVTGDGGGQIHFKIKQVLGGVEGGMADFNRKHWLHP